MISRTTLITAILFAPTSVRTMSNSVFSSAAAAPPSTGAATATAAAADTPNSSSTAFTSSESSRTVRTFNSSTIAVIFSDAILFSS